MSKTKTTYYTCDDCKLDFGSHNVVTLPLNIIGRDQHICKACVGERVRHSLTLKELGYRKCTCACGFTAQAHEDCSRPGMIMAKCPLCEGTRVQPLCE